MNSQLNWDLQTDESVFKFLKKIPRKDSEFLLFTVKLLPNSPYLGDIQKIKGEKDAWRRRVGRYRIFFKIKVKEKIILISDIKIRSSNTY
ncbi:hypothetical protein A3A95_01440 [Candidatus Nomurabacteria bacterium RIFCSPLOWO2_01_FULL_39_18]|uniref:Addiction module toxin RelE n=1 Tax=Candidatus Nomurabacteria bacterium RIFCSPHIGHO2_01_FULL_40_24b TaxID=1801739 RepID=A0A1F6V8H8_9BACT|nr:MAG: hypothetical protein A2647_00250 [Candidatus Nomurabacteria bacterium RIFCSPHIGHO2_01_FULL_40_24b]OGI88953.1 MAG: hypothetical protein A3A95_01440 [Candidatus Nomurabacteria bacterium RIFCSPLOWO2_01_FULL_39_18]